MKILAVVVVFTMCLLAGAAYAGDAAYNWSGIYGGAGIGFVHGDQAWKLRGSQWWNSPFSTDGKEQFTFNDFEVGAHLGAQYQWKWLVLGVEGGIYKGPADEQEKPSPYYPAADEWKADIRTIAKAVAKVGYAYDRFLFYAKGGYAGAMVETDARTVVGLLAGTRNKTSSWHSGWTFGAGIEYALTNHIIIGGEYSYLGLGSRTQSDMTAVGISYKAKVDATAHQVLFRVSYKFDVF